MHTLTNSCREILDVNYQNTLHVGAAGSVAVSHVDAAGDGTIFTVGAAEGVTVSVVDTTGDVTVSAVSTTSGVTRSTVDATGDVMVSAVGAASGVTRSAVGAAEGVADFFSAKDPNRSRRITCSQWVFEHGSCGIAPPR